MRARGAARIVVLTCASVGLFGQTTQDARALWEKMLAAKGISRSPVSTFVLSSKTVTGPAQGRRTIVASLPNGWWIFNDYRPGKLGASVEALDLAVNKGWIAYPHLGNPPEPIDPNTPGAVQDRERILAIFFCQAAGFEPTVFEAGRVRRGFKTYDVVKTRWRDELIYYLDPSTHLPSILEIVIKGTTTVPAYRDRPARKISYSDTTPIVMQDYREVSGIQVPARVKLWDTWEENRIELNVNVSPDLFGKPPAGVANADDWKKQQPTRPASP